MARSIGISKRMNQRDRCQTSQTMCSHQTGGTVRTSFGSSMITWRLHKSGSSALRNNRERIAVLDSSAKRNAPKVTEWKSDNSQQPFSKNPPNINERLLISNRIFNDKWSSHWHNLYLSNFAGKRLALSLCSLMSDIASKWCQKNNKESVEKAVFYISY